MELSLLPDTYMPILDNTGNYVDCAPSFDFSHIGIKCPCTGNIYLSKPSIKTHFKTMKHQTWLENKNANKMNVFVEYENMKELCEQQKKIIADLQKEINRKNCEIGILTEKIMDMKICHQSTNTLDLLDT